jgi:hypothetical protein
MPEASRALRSPWAAGILFGLLHFARDAVEALRMPIQRFDEGIQLSSGALIAHGAVPLRDFYQPYGPGFGLPGTIGRALFGNDLLADRLVYFLAPAVVTTLAYVFMTRRAGWLFGACLALITLASSVPRHALCWIGIFAGLLVVQRAIDSARGASFGAAAAARPRLFGLAGALIGTACWFRVEYGFAAVVWAIFVLWSAAGLSHARRMLVASVPVAVAILPYAAIAISGGFTELWRWSDYALFGFRQYRGLPVDLDPLASFFRAPFHASYDREGARLLMSYVAAALLAVLWIVHSIALRLRRPGLLERDPSLLAPFLAVVAVFLAYTQTVRFSAGNGDAILAGVWAAWLALRFRVRVRVLAAAPAVAGVLVVLPVLKPYATIVPDAMGAKDLNAAPETVPKFAHIPLGTNEWPSMAGIHALWTQAGMAGRPVLATNRRNDLTHANGAYLYWFLDAPPGGWSTTYDPGIGDKEEVQRDVAADLCANRAPIVEEDQDPSVSSNGEFGLSEHGNRYLDEFIALNYRSHQIVGFYRLRTRDTGRCTLPEETSDEAVRARRELALRRDDLPQAAALSTLLVERAEAAGRPAAGDDVAGAVLGGYWVPDAQLPNGPERPGLVALRERTLVPGEAAAATAEGGPLTRLATTTAYVDHRPSDAPPEQNAAVVAAMRRLTRDVARWPAVVRSLFAMQPPDVRVFEEVTRSGGSGLELERVRFMYLRKRGQFRPALRSGLRLLRLLAGRPLDQGAAFGDVALVLDALHEGGCARRARALGDSVPGVDIEGPQDPAAACGVELPPPALRPEHG